MNLSIESLKSEPSDFWIEQFDKLPLLLDV